jgi:hypothetical protein
MQRLMSRFGFVFAIGVALAACGGGSSAGPDGANSLVKTTAEPAGANCAAGGQRLQIGPDKTTITSCRTAKRSTRPLPATAWRVRHDSRSRPLRREIHAARKGATWSALPATSLPVRRCLPSATAPRERLEPRERPAPRGPRAPQVLLAPTVQQARLARKVRQGPPVRQAPPVQREPWARPRRSQCRWGNSCRARS